MSPPSPCPAARAVSRGQTRSEARSRSAAPRCRASAPTEVVAGRYHEGLAPLIILTGGMNQHKGIIEARDHRRILLEHNVPEDAIHFEEQSRTTLENLEPALPFLREALDAGLVLTHVCKWYQRRAIQALRRLL